MTAAEALTGVAAVAGDEVVGAGEVTTTACAGVVAEAALTPCFFLSSFQHLEQQSPVALLP